MRPWGSRLMRSLRIGIVVLANRRRSARCPGRPASARGSLSFRTRAHEASAGVLASQKIDEGAHGLRCNAGSIAEIPARERPAPLFHKRHKLALGGPAAAIAVPR